MQGQGYNYSNQGYHGQGGQQNAQMHPNWSSTGDQNWSSTNSSSQSQGWSQYPPNSQNQTYSTGQGGGYAAWETGYTGAQNTGYYPPSSASYGPGHPSASQQWNTTGSEYPPQAAGGSSGSAQWAYNAQGGRGTPEVHSYTRLPSTPQDTIDTYIKIIRLPDTEENQDFSARHKRAYQCTVQNCEKAARGEVFKSKDNARVHVHKHFGSEKLFQCVIPSCGKTFGSEDAAKRHRDTTDSKAYLCTSCNNSFARKDYRDWHQARCSPRN